MILELLDFNFQEDCMNSIEYLCTHVWYPSTINFVIRSTKNDLINFVVLEVQNKNKKRFRDMILESPDIIFEIHVWYPDTINFGIHGSTKNYLINFVVLEVQNKKNVFEI